MADEEENTTPEKPENSGEEELDMAAAMEGQTEQEAAKDGAEAGGGDDADGGNMNLQELDDAPPPSDDDDEEEVRIPQSANDLNAVYDIPVTVQAVLGQAQMQVSQLLRLGRGAVVELDRKVGEAIDIYVNNRLVARGEVVIVDERLGVTMTEIIKSDAH